MDPRHRAKWKNLLRGLVFLLLMAMPPDAWPKGNRHDRADVGAPPIQWSACYGRFECALYEVPLVHKRGARRFYRSGVGPGVELALIRLPATDPANRIGTLFAVPGGPANSGIDYVRFVGRRLYTPEVRSRFDIVGFDPRGTNSSSALSCFTPEDQLDQAPVHPVYPDNFSEFRERVRFERSFRRACARNAERIIDHMTTADVARDLNILREAVGDEQLNFSGISYATMIGVTYANLFPDRVRALILDAVIDPIAWTTGHRRDRHFPVSWRIRSDDGAMATLEEFFRLCDLAPTSRCAISGDAALRFERLAEQLAKTPVRFRVSPTAVVDADDDVLFWFTLNELYDSTRWSSFSKRLLVLEKLAAKEALLAGTGSPGLGLEEPEAPELVPGTFEGRFGVMCSDSNNPRSPFMWPLAATIAKRRFGYFGPIWTWFSSACANWPGSMKSRYAGPFSRWTANPVLVTSNLFDPATRYEGALIVANLLPNSHLLTVEGWGHVTLFLSPCATEIASDYLLEGVLPDEDSTCRQHIIPFGLSEADAFGESAESPSAALPYPGSETPRVASDSKMDERSDDRAQLLRFLRAPGPTAWDAE